MFMTAWTHSLRCPQERKAIIHYLIRILLRKVISARRVNRSLDPLRGSLFLLTLGYRCYFFSISISKKMKAKHFMKI